MKNEPTSLAEDLRNDLIQVRLGSMLDLITLASNMCDLLHEINHHEADNYMQQLRNWNTKE